MSNTLGIRLRKLSIRGEYVREATIDFKPGFNIISGVSNSGKTYILQSIGYVLGATTKPKEIKESIGYNAIFLECQDKQGEIYTLSRSIKSGKIYKYNSSLENINFAESLDFGKTVGEDSEISKFLLSKCGIDVIPIVKNRRGETQSITFNTILDWMLIDEVSIIDNKSILLPSGNRSIKTYLNTFNYLITHKKPQIPEVQENSEVLKTRYEAKKELLSEIHKEINIEIRKIPKNQSKNISKEKVKELRNQLYEQNEIIKEEQQEILYNNALLLENRHERSLIISATEKFLLLYDTYTSDIERLEFIMDGENFYEQLNNSSCPICNRTGSLPDELQNDLESIKLSYLNERDNILRKQREIKELIQVLKTQEEEIHKSILHIKHKINKSGAKINNELKPVFDKINENIDRLLLIEENQAKKQTLIEKRDMLMNKMIVLENEYMEKKGKIISIKTEIDHSAMKNICNYIQCIIKTWNIPDSKQVSFDYSDKVYDIRLNGQARTVFGKGYRALLKAAFWIGVMDYCKNNKLPFPFLLIFDTPLKNLKEHSDSEAIEDKVKMSFYNNLAEIGYEKQIIIIENEEPPLRIQKKCNYRFFKQGEGFFPTSND